MLGSLVLLFVAATAAAETDPAAAPTGFHEVTVADLGIRYFAADEGVGCEAIESGSEWRCVDDEMGDWAVRIVGADGPTPYGRLLVRLAQLRDKMNGRPLQEVIRTFGGAGLVCETMTLRRSGPNAHLATCRYVPAAPTGGRTIFVKLIGDQWIGTVGRIDFRPVSGPADESFNRQAKGYVAGEGIPHPPRR